MRKRLVRAAIFIAIATGHRDRRGASAAGAVEFGGHLGGDRWGRLGLGPGVTAWSAAVSTT